jgi:hypothetical protein
MYHESLEYLRETGSRGYITTLQVRYAALEEQRGNHTAAHENATEALEWARKLGMAREQAQAEAILERIGTTETPKN